jgi:hypothetical protein
MGLYGYPGPQVPRYPKRVTHQHRLQWNKESDGTRASPTYIADKISPQDAVDGSTIHASNRGKMNIV